MPGHLESSWLANDQEAPLAVACGFQLCKTMAFCQIVFSMERKNKVVGQLAAAIQNTTAMERSIMEELLAKELSISKPFDMSIGLA